MVSINPELSYLLPSNFSGDVGTPFFETTTAGHAAQVELTTASMASFVSYDQEFLDLFGTDPVLHLAAEKPFPFATEMGIWVRDAANGLNEVWTSSPSVNGTSEVWVIDLGTSHVFQPNTSLPIVNANGGAYHNGKVYIAADGNATTPPCIYVVDPVNGDTSIVVNSYFGLRFGGPNDLTWMNKSDGSNSSVMFFSDDPLSEIYNGGRAPQVPDAVWRFDPEDHSLIPVIDRADVLVPNGVRVNANQTLLYVTDTAPPTYGATLGSLNGASSDAIYVFDLDAQGFPSNKRMFGLAERGLADGIHVDDEGRVWTGEADGVVVRNSAGKVIGLVNALSLLSKDETSPLQNFALAGDTLVILALEKIFTVKLSRQIISGSP